MNDFEHEWHVEAKQKRGADAIQTISEAATLLAKEGRPELLTTRNLSEISGYSTGTLYRYFRRFEDIFVNLFLQRRTQAIDKIVLLIEEHPPAQEARFLVASIGVD
ncbi:MAG: TetR/AcrR family transcriptional regulator [Alcaligenaceae bacterium]